MELGRAAIAGWTHRGVGPEHHEASVEEHRQPNVDNGTKRRVTSESRLMVARVMGGQDKGIRRWRKLCRGREMIACKSPRTTASASINMITS